jgi:hypothetical protein
MVLNCTVTVEDELRIWQEAEVAYFKLSSRPERTEESYHLRITNHWTKI